MNLPASENPFPALLLKYGNKAHALMTLPCHLTVPSFIILSNSAEKGQWAKGVEVL